jgi:hypothetical protein
LRNNSYVRQSTGRTSISCWHGARDPVMMAHRLRAGLRNWKNRNSYAAVFRAAGA